MKRPLTEADVIAAIKANHLRDNIGHLEDHGWVADWDRARLDPGGGLFGPGPYAKVPMDDPDCVGFGVMVRVYPPEWLRKRLARDWVYTR